MTKVFQAQQEFLHNTTSTLVPGLNLTVQQVITVNANTFKLCDFIMGQTVDRERIVKGVVQKEGKVYLLHKSVSKVG